MKILTSRKDHFSAGVQVLTKGKEYPVIEQKYNSPYCKFIDDRNLLVTCPSDINKEKLEDYFTKNF